MKLSKAKQTVIENYGIEIQEDKGDYLIKIGDAEVMRGDASDINGFLDLLDETEVSEKVGSAIQNLRTKKGFDIPYMAYLLGKTPEELKLIEEGKMMPDDNALKKLGNYFGVSARELKKGQVQEIRQRNELRDVLNGISEVLASIKENTAELKNYLNELGMLADIMEPKQKHKSDEKTKNNEIERNQSKAETEKTPDESLNRYAVVPRNLTHVPEKSENDGYYVVVDTYTGEIVTDQNGMEERFTEEAVAFAFAGMLEKQASAKENIAELPHPDMENKKENELKDQESDIDNQEIERSEKVVPITRRR